MNRQPSFVPKYLSNTMSWWCHRFLLGARDFSEWSFMESNKYQRIVESFDIYGEIHDDGSLHRSLLSLSSMAKCHLQQYSQWQILLRSILQGWWSSKRLAKRYTVKWIIAFNGLVEDIIFRVRISRRDMRCFLSIWSISCRVSSSSVSFWPSLPCKMSTAGVRTLLPNMRTKQAIVSTNWKMKLSNECTNTGTQKTKIDRCVRHYRPLLY